MDTDSADIMGRLLEAVQFAAVKHRDQRRKDEHKTPYINHPIGVAYSIWKEGGVTDISVLQVGMSYCSYVDQPPNYFRTHLPQQPHTHSHTHTQAAVLHDTVEDTQTTFDELELNFGPEVRQIVQECSDDKTLPKMERKRLQVCIPLPLDILIVFLHIVEWSGDPLTVLITHTHIHTHTHTHSHTPARTCTHTHTHAHRSLTPLTRVTRHA